MVFQVSRVPTLRYFVRVRPFIAVRFNSRIGIVRPNLYPEQKNGMIEDPSAIPRTFQRLQQILPTIADTSEFEEAKEYMTLLSKFDSGIYEDKEVCERLRQILLNSKHKSEPFKGMMRISRSRLLRVLYTNHFFVESFHLLMKSKDGSQLVYQHNKVPPAIVAGILINMHREHELEKYIKWVVEDKDLDFEKRTKFIRSIVKNYMHLDSIGLGLKFWHDYCFAAYGQLQFSNRTKYADCLSSLYLIVNQYKASNILKFLIKFKQINKLSNHHFSSLLSSCIYSLGVRVRHQHSIQQIWSYKEQSGLELFPSDLTIQMEVLQSQGLNNKVLKLHEKYPQLHEDAQFDSLLRAHGEEHNWQAMQQQFEALFGRGELPNIVHYAIVMNALAEKGETTAVMMLWDQLNTRKMIPTIDILHGLIRCNINTGNYRNAVAWFQEIPKYGLAYNSQSYTHLFKALGGLNELKVQLQFFKKLIFEEKMELDTQVFLQLLATCFEKDDWKTAEFVMKTAKDLGYHLGQQAELLMLNVYSNNKQFKKVDHLIASKLEDLRANPEDSRGMTKFYNQLVQRYFMTDDYEMLFELVSKMRAAKVEFDLYTYTYLINALIRSDKMDNALQLFGDLKPKFQVKHFNKIMQTLYHSDHYKTIPQIYDTMIERSDLNPNFASYTFLIKGLCKQFQLDRADRELTVELAVKIVNTLLVDKAKGELHTIKKNIPFGMIYRLLMVLIDYNLQLAKNLLVDFYNSCDDKLSLENDIRFNYVSLKMHEKDKNEKEFENLFTRYSSLLKTKFAIDPETEEKSLQLTANYVKYGLSSFWPSHLAHAKRNGTLPQLSAEWQELLKSGFAFSNRDYNQTVVALLRSKDSFEDALHIIERKLISGYIYLRAKRKNREMLERSSTNLVQSNVFNRDKPALYLEGLSYIKMIQILRSKILPKDPEKRSKMLAKLTFKYPQTLKLYSDREEVIDSWWTVFLKLGKKNYKKVRMIASQQEFNMTRHKQKKIRKRQLQEMRSEQIRIKQLQRRRRARTSGKYRVTRRISIRRPPRMMAPRMSSLTMAPPESTEYTQTGQERKPIPSPFTSRMSSIVNELRQ